MACFRNPAFGNTHNLTAPPDDRAALWSATGVLHATWSAVAIGPRLVCVAGHVTGGIIIGSSYVDFAGVHCIVTGIHTGVVIDAAYLTLDRDVPHGYAKLWDGEAYSTANNLFVVHGLGYGRGTEIFVGPTLVGWNVGDITTTLRRWSQGKLFRFDPNVSFASRFEDPASEVAWCFTHDSSSGCFIDVGTGTGLDKWLYIGPVTGTASDAWARFDTSYECSIGQSVHPDLALIETLNGETTVPKTITITEPPDGFDMAGSKVFINGVTTGDLPEVTVQVNTTLHRVTISGGEFQVILDIPVFPEPSPLTIQAYDGVTFAGSTIFSNIVHGEAVNLPPDPPDPGPGPVPIDPTHWREEGYETLLQSEISLFENDSEKTVRDFALDFTHADEAGPLFCHSQVGVGGLPNCIDWWTSEPWPLDCNLFGNIDPTKRNTGPMTWPYYATGRYVGWRLFVSSQSDPPDYSPKGGEIDFNRVSMTISVKSSCR